jgi:hypothetical protein
MVFQHPQHWGARRQHCTAASVRFLCTGQGGERRQHLPGPTIDVVVLDRRARQMHPSCPLFRLHRQGGREDLGKLCSIIGIDQQRFPQLTRRAREGLNTRTPVASLFTATYSWATKLIPSCNPLTTQASAGRYREGSRFATITRRAECGLHGVAERSFSPYHSASS